VACTTQQKMQSMCSAKHDLHTWLQVQAAEQQPTVLACSKRLLHCSSIAHGCHCKQQRQLATVALWKVNNITGIDGSAPASVRRTEQLFGWCCCGMRTCCVCRMTNKYSASAWCWSQESAAGFATATLLAAAPSGKYQPHSTLRQVSTTQHPQASINHTAVQMATSSAAAKSVAAF
jgi:hypothetical protein